MDAKIQKLDQKIDMVEERLQGEIHKINLKLETDIEVMQDVIKEHGQVIKVLTA